MNALQTGQDEAQAPTDQDGGAPACVMSFNANDPSGASGIGADIATVAAMGAHALPVVTSTNQGIATAEMRVPVCDTAIAASTPPSGR